MKDKLTITSLISILLFSLHWVDEITRGLEPGKLSGVWGGIAILGVWLYATLGLGDGRLRYIILLLASILGVGVLVGHSLGAGLVGGKVGASGTGVFFWVWTIITLGTLSTFSAILAGRGLWSTLRRKP
jgi:hypothetical protein